MPPASASRCRSARCARRWRCARTCWRRVSPASGARRSSTLLALLNRRVHPRVPSRGSVGASGDLAPLAHLSLVLIGEGEATVGDDPAVLDGRGRARPRRARAGDARTERGARAHQRHAAVDRGRRAGARRRRAARARGRHRGGAVDRRAARIDPAVRRRGSTTRGRYDGQVSSAAQHPRAAGRQRDQRVARALRPRPGRLLDALRAAGARRRARRARLRPPRSLTIEANARDRQPDGLSGPDGATGTTKSSPAATSTARPIALAADLLVLALAQLATISERRSDRLVNPALSDLPAFLTRDSGLHSGFMMAQVTAAALASEIKTLAHPASVDTIPTSANREDHVSMSMGAALKAPARAPARHARRRHRDALRVPGDRPARAAARPSAALARVHARVRATRADARPTIVRRRPTSRRLPRGSRTARSNVRATEKSSKKFFNFNLTTRAYVS